MNVFFTAKPDHVQVLFKPNRIRNYSLFNMNKKLQLWCTAFGFPKPSLKVFFIPCRDRNNCDESAIKDVSVGFRHFSVSYLSSMIFFYLGNWIEQRILFENL